MVHSHARSTNEMNVTYVSGTLHLHPMPEEKLLPNYDNFQLFVVTRPRNSLNPMEVFITKPV